MRHVFYKHQEKLTDKQHWYLEHYLHKSDYLERAYQLKEGYRQWFEVAKTCGQEGLGEIKDTLYRFYDLVRASGVVEFERAISTFHNWQKEILNSFAFDLHNAFGFGRFDRFRLKVLLHHQYKDVKIRIAKK
ncbi:Transposase [Pelagirhabdus alkalitolerans]|uniref:Transposase n=1 Tax=Pelagirhabdus alkalitolerans TaxID=1612202 RepID=A0A1G6KBC7_9BACI|nr:Transposase [Pelagirhabdus alkalitolerans]